jgi:predicted transcriptional regulator
LAKKKKMSGKEISERARINAENSPIVRQLRELYERGMAEIEERRKLDPNAR